MTKDFFTSESFYSLAGASGMVYVVCNALQAALNFNPRWLALVLAEVIAVFGTYAAQSARVPSDYFVAVLNGCLIYCTAVGGSTLGHSTRTKGRSKGTSPDDPGRRSFWDRWY
jgi:hypothetical protein